MNWKRLVILVLFDLRHSLFKIKGLLFLIPFFCFWYWIFKLLVKNGTDFLVTEKSFGLTFLIFRDAEIVKSLLINNPPALSVFLVFSVATMPFFIMLAGNNQLAADAGTCTLRFLLTRCTRFELYISRFLSSYLLIVFAFIITVFIAFFISLKYDNFSLNEIITYTWQVMLITLVYAIPFVAFMASISAFMSSALGTLLMSVVIYITLLILGYYLPFDFSLLPSGLKQYLYIPGTSNLVNLLTGIVTYTLIYAGIGWLIFNKRNL